MEINFDYQPMPVHTPFHLSTAKHRMLFGAFGSGKTYAVVAEAIAWCLEQPGIRGCITRKTVPELRDSTEPIVLELLPSDLLQACTISRSGGHIERILFPNGSTILFRSMDVPLKWRSLNLGFIAFDECNEIGEDDYNEVVSRLRQRDITVEARQAGYKHEITRQGSWGATNPAGHDWLWRRFHPDSPDRAPGTACFTSTTLDNPYLPISYVEDLLQMPKPYIARFVLCQFDDFAGRIYEDWNSERHLIKPIKFSIPNREMFWMSFDPGTRAPSAALWVWLDRANRRLVGVADYEQPEMAADVHAAGWRQVEALQRMNVRYRVADVNAITQRDRGSLISLQTTYAKLGFNFQLSNANEDQRILALARQIYLNRFVVTENCLSTYEAIRDYQWKDLTTAQRTSGEEPKPSPLKKNTHLVECAQFLVATREMPAPKLNPYDSMTDREAFNYDIHKALKRNQRGKLKPTQNHDLGTIPV